MTTRSRLHLLALAISLLSTACGSDPGPAGGGDAALPPTGAGFATGCIPIASSMGMCTDPSRPYAYVCANAQQPPEGGCETGVGPIGNIACCAHSFCVRDDLSDYQCGDLGHPPSAFLCYDDAPADVSDCWNGPLSGASNSSTRVCCP